MTYKIGTAYKSHLTVKQSTELATIKLSSENQNILKIAYII